MKDKGNALITGSSRGIGLAIARGLGQQGYNVTLNCSISEHEMALAVETLRAEGISARGLCADVSDYENCRRLIAFGEEAFGAIDVLVNNAGAAYYGLFTEMTPEDWRHLTETNLYSAYHCCHLVLPEMIRRKSGRIINISSMWGTAGASCEAVYSATKGALNAFTKALAKEVAPSNIFVNAIACGVIDTRMNDNLSAEEKAALAAEIPLMRMGTPEEVAALCLYLAETTYMTGQILGLDGGVG